MLCFFFQAEDGIRDHCVTGVQTCALPISIATDETLATELPQFDLDDAEGVAAFIIKHLGLRKPAMHRSEEHTSELQSHSDLVCRLLLEKKNRQIREIGATLLSAD